jgi:lactate dehydrogenase-like 2-hydroxyacid dehydrogenase
MERHVSDILDSLLPREGRVGIVGVGAFGTEVRDFVVRRGLEPVLCDPPRNLEEAEELGEHFFDLWGNGMGGCGLSNEGMEVFLPLDALAKTDAIVLSVPLSCDGPFATCGMISGEFLRQCRPDLRIICLCDKAVVAEECQGDNRIVYL